MLAMLNPIRKMRFIPLNKRLFLGTILSVAFLAGALSGMYFGYLISPYSWLRSGKKSVMIDVNFIPNTETTSNPWGAISTVESFYLHKEKRVLHGQRIKFLKAGNAIEIESYVDGDVVGLSSKGGPPMPYDLNLTKDRY